MRRVSAATLVAARETHRRAHAGCRRGDRSGRGEGSPSGRTCSLPSAEKQRTLRATPQLCDRLVDASADVKARAALVCIVAAWWSVQRFAFRELRTGGAHGGGANGL
jgi:hypothetical protein